MDPVPFSSLQEPTIFDKEFEENYTLLRSISLPLSENILPASEVGNVGKGPFDGGMEGKIVMGEGEGDVGTRGEENGGDEDNGMVQEGVSDSEVQINSPTPDEDQAPHSPHSDQNGLLVTGNMEHTLTASEVGNVGKGPFDGGMEVKTVKGDVGTRGEENGGDEDSGMVQEGVSDSEVHTNTPTPDEDQAPHSPHLKQNGQLVTGRTEHTLTREEDITYALNQNLQEHDQIRQLKEKIEQLKKDCHKLQKARLTGSQEFSCPFCGDKNLMINSHIVPESVLLSLCCWKSGYEGRDGRYTKDEQKKMKKSRYYMFRTDIAKGKTVTAAECTTREPNKYLCGKCEDSMQYLDDRASYFWQCLPRNWHDRKELRIGCKGCKELCIRCEGCKDITSIFLFSVVARAMYLSTWSKKIRDILDVFIEETDRNTYPKTTARLEEAHFSHYCLTNPTDKTYRIEFPFECDIKLNGKNIIKTICAQIPPFFIFMPKDGYDNFADDLKRDICDIIPRVHRELQKQLEWFYAQERYRWYKKLIEDNHIIPLLVFDYIKEYTIKVSV